MTDEHLRHNANLIDSLGSALRSGEHGLNTVPALLKRVLQEQSWREFVTKRGELVEHERFTEFVTTPPLSGLGASVELVQRIVGADDEAAKLLRDALKERSGPRSSGNNITRTTVTGTSRGYALDRLQRDAPELHADVLAGNLSAHAAMVKAGFRHRTVTVPVDDPKRIAATLRRQLTPEALSALAELLQGEPDGMVQSG